MKKVLKDSEARMMSQRDIIHTHSSKKILVDLVLYFALFEDGGMPSKSSFFRLVTSFVKIRLCSDSYFTEILGIHII